MKTWAIGDIHGCIYTLNNMLVKLESKWDKLIFLGDYIDRGLYSKDVINIIMDLQLIYGNNIVVLKGNHEDMCLHAHGKYGDQTNYSLGRAWYYNGADETLKSFNSDTNKIPNGYLDWMMKLKSHYEDNNAYYVHAGFRPDIKIEKQNDYDKFWIREEFLDFNYNFGKPVIHGHTPFKQPQVGQNRISIDTGCCFGDLLTAYCVETGEIISINMDKKDK